jgi:hypothetical protein
MANWNKKNTGRPVLADNARASIELIADRIDNLEKGLAGDESLIGIDIKGGTLDNVPIGGTTPKSGAFTDITASGHITNTGDYKYSSAKTKTITIPATAFIVHHTNGAFYYIDNALHYTQLSIDNGIMFGIPGRGRNLNMSFNPGFIPHGATITNITFYQHSSSGDDYDFRCYLYRLNLADKTSTLVDDTGNIYVSGTNMNSSAVLDAGVTLDYSNYAYSFRMFLYSFNGNSSFYLYGAKITYTIDEL